MSTPRAATDKVQPEAYHVVLIGHSLTEYDVSRLPEACRDGHPIRLTLDYAAESPLWCSRRGTNVPLEEFSLPPSLDRKLRQLNDDFQRAFAAYVLVSDPGDLPGDIRRAFLERLRELAVELTVVLGVKVEPTAV